MLLFAGLCGIFAAIQVDLGPTTVKPFDLITLIAGGLLILPLVRSGQLPASPGFALFGLYITIHVALAFAVSTTDGAKEALQGIELVLFAAVLTYLRSALDWQRLGRWFVLVAIVLTAINIGWHVSQGFYVGWKRLDEPKLLLTYGTVALLAMLAVNRKRAGVEDYLILALLAGILILSGERKAQLAFGVHLLVLIWAGYIRPLHVALAALVTTPVLAVIIQSTPYLAQQVESVVSLTADQKPSLNDLTTGETGLTPSNAQRRFAWLVSLELIRDHLLLGVGTNGYEPYVQKSYFWMHPKMLLAIHNEFQRVIVENGLLGLIAYVTPWLRAAAYIPVMIRRIGRRRAAAYIMFLTAFFVQCLFESAGIEAFLAFLFVCLLPELTLSAQPNRMKTKQPSTLTS